MPPPVAYVPYRHAITAAIGVLVWVVIAVGVLVLWGCTTAPGVPTADIPVPVAVDCHKMDPGPLPDLTQLARLQPTDSAQTVLQAVQDALATLAQDDRRLRALMGE